MNWRRGILLAAINVAVALLAVVWLDSIDATLVREHENKVAKQATTESPAAAPSQSTTTSSETVTFTIDPCGLIDGYSVQQQVVGLVNIPAEALAGWRDLCPARWTLSGMLHTGGWPTAATMPAQRKADIAFLLLVAIQWFLVGGFPLKQSKRPWGEPGTLITICAVLSIALVFIPHENELARFPALLAAFGWLWWFGLLVWKLARSGWKWTARHLARAGT